MDQVSIQELIDQNKAKHEDIKRLNKQGKRLIYCVYVYMLVGALAILSLCVWSFFAKRSLIEQSIYIKEDQIEE